MSAIRVMVDVLLPMVEGIYELAQGSADFKSLERGAQRLALRAAGKVLETILADADQTLSRERDSDRLRLVGKKERNVLTPLGEIRFSRRYYHDRDTGRRRFLLDEQMGLQARQRISPWMEELLARAAVDMPYHRAAGLLNDLGVGPQAVTAMSIWQTVQRAGRHAAEAAARRRREVFECGHLPPGERRAERLGVEVDEVVLRGRRKKGAPSPVVVKLGAAYEGKVELAAGRRALEHRRVVAGVARADVFWEELLAEMGRTWDLEASGPVAIGGDGAGWIKQGLDLFPDATYRLDPFHLRRRLREALGHQSALHQQVCEAISSGEWMRVHQALRTAWRGSAGKRRERVASLERYLAANWEGIRASDEACSLGAIEGQVFHHSARRMKKHGGSWSARGADNLARLLASRANGELHEHTPRAGEMRETLRALMDPARTAECLRPLRQDPEAWLRASIPALGGPHASKPWVKWVLRGLSRSRIPA